MEKKFTKGNWQTWTLDNGSSFLTNEGQIAVMSDSNASDEARRICLVDAQKEGVKKKDLWNTPDEERSANAKLIVAAPDLLEALEAVTKELERISDRDVSGEIVEALLKSKQAINKALK